MADPQIVIRPATRADRDAVASMWTQFGAELAAVEPRFALADDALERWTNDYAHLIDDRFRGLWVAEQDGRLVGFAAAACWSPAPIYRAPDEAFVHEVYVAPAARGRGVAPRMLDAIRAWAGGLGLRRLRASILSANDAGAAFWRDAGGVPYAEEWTLELDGTVADDEDTGKVKHPLGF